MVVIRTKMFSASLSVKKVAGYKFLPIMPMETAAASETAHQMVAILLENLISSLSRMAINLRSTWGIPK